MFITDSTDPDIASLEARHRGHARVEDRIREAKDCGLSNLPFKGFALNAAWLQLVLIAQDLLAWAKLLLFEGKAKRAEPKRLRFCFWHVAGRIIQTGRRVILRLAANWPWAQELASALRRLRALPRIT